MKEYKWFILTFAVLLAIYIIAEVNRPRPLNWEVTLSMRDKNPYGAYCLYNELKDIFPRASINPYSLPAYNQVNNSRALHTAYLFMTPSLSKLSKEDVHELLHYTAAGNYVFLSAFDFGMLQDTLKFRFDWLNESKYGDSTSINFRNPLLHTKKNTRFKPMTLEQYFTKYDTLTTTVLGSNDRNKANFIKMRFGKGAVFIHVMPHCFSNNFLLTRDNASYTAKALSYIPADVDQVFWDEYYKPGRTGSDNPLRYILNDPDLRWAFRIGLVTMVLFVLFGIKRRQRIIPVITPLQNSTMDFVKTVGNVYFNKKDNKNIAEKMIGYFLEYIRAHFFLPTHVLDEPFVQALSKKTGVPQPDLDELIKIIDAVQTGSATSNEVLLQLNRQLDAFYLAAQ